MLAAPRHVIERRTTKCHRGQHQAGGHRIRAARVVSLDLLRREPAASQVPQSRERTVEYVFHAIRLLDSHLRGRIAHPGLCLDAIGVRNALRTRQKDNPVWIDVPNALEQWLDYVALRSRARTDRQDQRLSHGRTSKSAFRSRFCRPSPARFEGGVGGALAADEGGEGARLELDDRAQGVLVALVRLAALQSLQDLLGELAPCAVAQPPLLDLRLRATVEQAEDRAVDDRLAELLDQVQGKTRLAGAIDVQEARVGVEARQHAGALHLAVELDVLLAGERLQADLRRLEATYLDQNARELEITKHISLALNDPIALQAFKTDGVCFFDLSEELFDLDHPGHYLRRIKNVSLTIPCITGPYTSIACSLALTAHRVRYRLGDKDGQPNGYAWKPNDPRFQESYGQVEQIVTSSAQNDAGLFETNLRDERYLPFEGAGAISSWTLQMPKELAQFDWSTITDAIVHLRYTARDGGPKLREGAITNLGQALSKGIRLLSARHDVPEGAYRMPALARSHLRGSPIGSGIELPARRPGMVV